MNDIFDEYSSVPPDFDIIGYLSRRLWENLEEDWSDLVNDEIVGDNRRVQKSLTGIAADLVWRDEVQYFIPFTFTPEAFEWAWNKMDSNQRLDYIRSLMGVGE